jgi:hypothetical protein
VCGPRVSRMDAQPSLGVDKIPKAFGVLLNQLLYDGIELLQTGESSEENRLGTKRQGVSYV